MRQLERQIVLEPQLTSFQVGILQGMVEKATAALREEAKTNPSDIASVVASIMEYDGITAALKAEQDFYQKHRRR